MATRPNLLLPQDAMRELPEECCGKCKYGKITKNASNRIDLEERECRKALPTHSTFLVQGPNGQHVVLEHAGWAKVTSDAWCSQFTLSENALLEKAKELQS